MPAGHLRRPEVWCAAILVMLAQGGCGFGSESCELPPGEPGSGAQTGRTLLVVEPNADLGGDPDSDEFRAYRIADNGSLLDPPEARPARNPHRLLVHEWMLYVAEDDRVSAYHLDEEGMPAATPSSQTSADARPDDPQGVEPPRADPIDFALVGGVLYVVERGRAQIAAYHLEEGELPPFPSTEGRGPLTLGYRGVALIGTNLYASDRLGFRLDVFSLDEAGDFLEDDPETADVVETVAQPEASVFANAPAALLARGGILYAAEHQALRIVSYTAEPDGKLPEEGPTSVTPRRALYEHLAVNGNLIYAASFDRGQVDVYELAADGTLPPAPMASTEGCPVVNSNGIAVLPGAVYVSESGLDRIDVFLTDPAGIPEATPSFSVALPPGSFPTDLKIFIPPG